MGLFCSIFLTLDVEIITTSPASSNLASKNADVSLPPLPKVSSSLLSDSARKPDTTGIVFLITHKTWFPSYTGHLSRLEGDNNGFRILGANGNYYGDIGDNALDLSYANTGTSNGALSCYLFNYEKIQSGDIFRF